MLCYPQFTKTFFSRTKQRKTGEQFMPFADRILAEHKKINKTGLIGEKEKNEMDEI